MWGAVAWEKTPGGRDTHNPDVSKQNRPTLGMPILIDMKKKPGVDHWEGQVYNAKDGQFYSSTIKPVDPDQLEIQGCVLGFLCGGETWTRVARSDSVSPANSMAKGAPKTTGALPKTAAADSNAAAPGTTGSVNPAAKARPETGNGRAAGRSGRRYLPTPRHRAVCPLAPAETAAPRRAW